MRYNFIYSLISINLFINILGLFLLALEVIGKEKLLKFKELLHNPPVKYKKRKKGLITLSFFILIVLFLLLNSDSFDVIKLNIVYYYTVTSVDASGNESTTDVLAAPYKSYFYNPFQPLDF